jgi:hypothetical protein
LSKVNFDFSINVGTTNTFVTPTHTYELYSNGNSISSTMTYLSGTTPFVFSNVNMTVYGNVNDIVTAPIVLVDTTTSTNVQTYHIQIFSSYPCFKEGSKILTDKGYIPIENLRKGDLVKTLRNDYIPIHMIGKREIYHSACQEERLKDQLYKYTNDNCPEVFEDLILTGYHCVLVDNFKDEKQKEDTIEVNGRIFVTDNKYRLPACVDDRSSVYEKEGNYMIYHFALENDSYYMNYGIYANGLLVETCSQRYLNELSGMELID